MWKRYRVTPMMITIISAVLLYSMIGAAVPQVINFQGRITSPSGQTVPDGNYLIQFRIYNAASGGTILWDNGYRTISVVNGLFAYSLGDSTILPPSLMIQDTSFYLGVRVGTDPELSPRSKLMSVLFAYKSSRSDTAQCVVDNAITTSKINDGAIALADIGQNGAAPGQILKWNGSTWTVAQDDVGGPAGWSDVGTQIVLSNINDSVGVGAYPASSKLEVAGDLKVREATLRVTGVNGHIRLGDSAATDPEVIASAGKHFLSASDAVGIDGYVSVSGGNSATGIKGRAIGNTMFSKGVEGDATSLFSTGYAMGVYGSASGGRTAYGIMGVSFTADTSIGVYGAANGSNVDWAGYFDGKVKIQDKLSVGLPNPAKSVDVGGSIRASDTIFARQIEAGSSATDGEINVYRSGSAMPIASITPDPGGQGGILELHDESGSFTHSLKADPDGSGGTLNVWRDASNIGFSVDGNYSGTGNPRVDITGAAASAIFNMSTTGNASVILPTGSVSSAEILDDPGIAANYGALIDVTLTSTMQDLVTVTITTPAAGYVLLEGKCEGTISGTTGVNVGNVQIDETSGGTIVPPYYSAFGCNAAPNTSLMHFPVSVTRVYSKGAGTYTFRLEAAAAAGNNAAAVTKAVNAILTASFFPTSYGTVLTVAAGAQKPEN